MENKTALLVLDVQNGYFNQDKFIPYKGKEVINNIQTLINRAHDEGAMVIFMQHTDEDQGLVKGSKDWEILESLPRLDRDYVIEKTTPNAFLKTKLHELLSREEIKYLVITGIQTESTIDTTCRMAFTLGYHNILVKDAHTTFDALPLTAEDIIHHHHRIMGQWFAELIESKDIEFF